MFNFAAMSFFRLLGIHGHPAALVAPVMKLWFAFCPFRSARPIVTALPFAQ
jgi:hypothetical protein